MNEIEAIRNLYIDYWDKMISKDIEGLREIMSEKYYLMHMTGVRQTREEFLNGLKNGAFNYFSAQHEEIDIKINQDSAKMIGKSIVEAAVYGGGKHTWRLKGDFEVIKENGTWKLYSSKASTY